MARTVVVTGGGTGMGRAITERFVASGDHVVVVGRRQDVLDRIVAAHPDRVRAVRADLTDDDDVLHAVDALDGGQVDVLVNNASGFPAVDGEGLPGRFARLRATLDANLLSAVLLTEALWPSLARPGGRVVSISSIAAQRGGGGAYAVAKAGLVGWGYDLAARGGPEGITANTVSPGYVQDTELFSPQGRSGRHDALVAQTLLGRAGVPDDVAGAVHWLASPDAAWITGQVLAVNGGARLGP
ncbi:SDR family NAD(P)-dependent oxidoreductase [Cellulomonas oligotrophica]|uniref:3-oxoacyl-ACP reductase n=1 Tax=Cellulomonas oligotrophica TaxID=931536 RepID=A0A7Y9FCR2_9CELL|nr:SDR family oxidoreductase [Cellulomonas oligotrophica]NYD84938.1 3-oxoacyl-[acyl-carrier protein] reductase [Cellulomonas oligotrophica]GIG32008.1 3-oxoacyl-ACP reductase [Cellulomonas oligotrophica]